MSGNGKKTIVVALGGNAITREFEEGTITQQFANTRRALSGVVDLAEQGHRLALTHGNGPQVGNAMIRVEEARGLVPPLPLGIIVADLQGGMGYMIQQTMQNKLMERGIDRGVVTFVTQVLVNKKDPSIYSPTKFVGPTFNAEQVPELEKNRGWVMREDKGRGWRRVVPSPVPIDIVEKAEIWDMVHRGVIVIACGGGGAPVYREPDGKLEGIDGVVDKDLASAVLARVVNAEALYILTSVEKVAVHFATPAQKWLDRLTVAEAEALMAEGHFPSGSMGPKIRAAIEFLKSGGKECLITSTEKLVQALRGETGTWVVP